MSQQGETINSQMKSDPTTKAQMRSWNLWQLMSRVDSLLEQKRNTTIKDLIRLIASDKNIGKWVEDRIDSSILKSYQMMIEEKGAQEIKAHPHGARKLGSGAFFRGLQNDKGQ